MNANFTTLRIRKLAHLATAALLLNLAALSCTMAADICMDEMGDHAPSMCADPCSSDISVAGDKSSEFKTSYTPATTSAAVSGIRFDLDLGEQVDYFREYWLHDPSPPINLLNCVFLK
jgi:hypothetical protein